MSLDDFGSKSGDTVKVGCAAPAPDKARELHNAIGRIDEVIERLSGLCERIATGGGDRKVNEDIAIDPHTFANLMSNGSNEIDKKCAVMLEKITEIENTIF